MFGFSWDCCLRVITVADLFPLMVIYLSHYDYFLPETSEIRLLLYCIKQMTCINKNAEEKIPDCRLFYLSTWGAE